MRGRDGGLFFTSTQLTHVAGINFLLIIVTDSLGLSGDTRILWSECAGRNKQ